MPQLEILLTSLSPIGKKFFEGYIHKKPQFILMVDKFTKYIDEHGLPLIYIQLITN